jgi:hypothetical protein
MGKDYDFMLKEYQQIATIYIDLHAQKDGLLKFYTAIIGGGGSVIILLTSFNKGGIPLTISPLIFCAGVGLLAILLSMIGSVIFLSIAGLRMEMILYVRTINALRAYFVESDRKEKQCKYGFKGDLRPNAIPIKDFLVLPDYDQKTPSFRESPITHFFWIVVLIALINSVLLLVGYYFVNQIFFVRLSMEMITSFLRIPFQKMVTMPLVSCALLVLWPGIHYLFYYLMAFHMEDKYRVKRKKPEDKNLQGTIII